ncbi:MAG: TatD family hydrolase [Candidatus Bathyarchaeia archaeon]
MFKLIDTHAHISDLDNPAEAVERAKAAGVEAILAVGADMETCRATLELAGNFTGYIYPALGIHPTEIVVQEIPDTIKFIEENIEKCAAVGEIGLDYWSREARKNREIRDLQRDLYIQQLRIASDKDKPVSIHARGSWRDALDLAKIHGPKRGVFHWYSGPLDILKELLDSGYYISATIAAEYSKEHRAALTHAPLERILIETDSPVVYRGSPSEPADLVRTLRALSELKGLPLEDVAQATTRNAEKVFKIRI